jgi:RNA polymerase sigma factor (sigma-70 family)
MTQSIITDERALSDTVARAKGGDAHALEQVVAAVQDDVYRLALRMTAHPQDAEDASQEILVKVITRLEGFRGESSLRTWAYRIAVHHMLDRR